MLERLGIILYRLGCVISGFLIVVSIAVVLATIFDGLSSRDRCEALDQPAPAEELLIHELDKLAFAQECEAEQRDSLAKEIAPILIIPLILALISWLIGKALRYILVGY